MDIVDTCESCARPDDDLVTVQRMYLVSAADAPISDPAPAPIAGDIERWCFSCRTQYAHVELPTD